MTHQVFTAQEREWVLTSVIGSQALAGVVVSRERAAELLDEVEARHLRDITEDHTAMTDIADRRIIQTTPPVPAYTPSRARTFLRVQVGRVLSDQDIIDIVATLLLGGRALNIDFALCFAQFCVETDNGRFTGTVPASAHNPAGIGALTDTSEYIVFANWRAGVLAYFVHLLTWCDRLDLALALTDLAPTDLDPRVPVVIKVRATKGRALTWRDLGGRWAVRSGIDWQQQATMTNPPNYGAIIACLSVACIAWQEVTPASWSARAASGLACSAGMLFSSCRCKSLRMALKS